MRNGNGFAFGDGATGAKEKGLHIPVGAGIIYLPTPNRTFDHDQMKFEPRARSGIFIGYHMDHGSTWRGEYLIADLDDIMAYGFRRHSRVFLLYV